MGAVRWYQFEVAGLEGSLFIQVRVGDDVMKKINHYVKKVYLEAGITTKVFQLTSLCEASSCSGCRGDQPNQQAHMDRGGCLYEPSQSSPASQSSPSSERSSSSSSRSRKSLKRTRSGTASNPISISSQ